MKANINHLKTHIKYIFETLRDFSETSLTEKLMEFILWVSFAFRYLRSDYTLPPFKLLIFPLPPLSVAIITSAATII